ncbi:MAG: hypothetical protein J6W63_07375, partial [Treponema sp.]|nr:hypothetical protein [Treponema sp.]
MKNEDVALDGNKNINNALDSLYSRKQAPWTAFAFILLLYALATFLLFKIGRNDGIFNVFGNPIPYSIFTGVFSSVANLCIIFLVVFFRKPGYITAVVILLTQFP